MSVDQAIGDRLNKVMVRVNTGSKATCNKPPDQEMYKVEATSYMKPPLTLIRNSSLKKTLYNATNLSCSGFPLLYNERGGYYDYKWSQL